MSGVQHREFSVQGSESSVQSPASSVQRPDSNVQSPESSVQSPESRVQRPEPSVQGPVSWVQRPGSNFQLLRPESRNSDMPHFLRGMLSNIKTRHFASSINHQEHQFHRTFTTSYFRRVNIAKFLRAAFP